MSAVGFAKIMVDRQETGRTLPDVIDHRIKVETRNLSFWYAKTQALFNVTTVLSTLIAMFLFDWRLTLLSVGILPIFAIIGVASGRSRCVRLMCRGIL